MPIWSGDCPLKLDNVSFYGVFASDNNIGLIVALTCIFTKSNTHYQDRSKEHGKIQ